MPPPRGSDDDSWMAWSTSAWAFGNTPLMSLPLCSGLTVMFFLRTQYVLCMTHPFSDSLGYGYMSSCQGFFSVFAHSQYWHGEALWRGHRQEKPRDDKKPHHAPKNSPRWCTCTLILPAQHYTQVTKVL